MKPENRNYYPNLDIIRFLAAFWVMLAHYGHIGPYMGLTGYGPSQGIAALLFQYGYLGVPIFFILSGFVIAHVSTDIHPLRFMSNRILRLMPAFWICMTVSFLLIALLDGTNILNLKLWFANLLLLPQTLGQPFVDGVYWTLVLEFVFYGWVFILLLSDVFHKHLLKICSIWLGISFANIMLLENRIIELVFITYYAGAFVCGLVMWHAKQNRWTAPHALLMVISGVSLSLGIKHLGIQAQLPNFSNQPDLLVSTICAILSIGAVAIGIFGKIIPIKHSFAVMLGAISYPLYLIHQEVGYLVLQKLAELRLNPIQAVTLVILLVITLSYIVHQACEKPIRRFLKSEMAYFVMSRFPRLNQS
jgi:peptidoglycan/LPS O-acetylase OafA/YrhL